MLRLPYPCEAGQSALPIWWDMEAQEAILSRKKAMRRHPRAGNTIRGVLEFQVYRSRTVFQNRVYSSIVQTSATNRWLFRLTL